MPDTLVAEKHPKVKTTKAVLAAGRQAFLTHRNTLDDLRDYFDVDLDAFLSAIFESMTAAARLEAA